MNDKHNQHTLPKFYLKGFASIENADRIWVYTKGKPFLPGRVELKHNPVLTAIRRASVVRDAYAFERHDGTLDVNAYEDELQKLEKPSDAIFRNIRAGKLPTAEEKRTLTSYICLTYKRVPQREERIRGSWTEFAENNSAIKYYGSEEFLSRLSTEKRAEVEMMLADRKQAPTKEILLKTMVAEWETVPIYLAHMVWRFLVADKEARYFTGDNPVFTSGLGLKSVAAELTFPISTAITLHASWQHGQDEFLSAPEEYVRQLNQRTATNSRQLFYCRGEEWVVNDLNRGNFPIFILDVSGGAASILWEHHLKNEL